jgi:hypothetical protein
VPEHTTLTQYAEPTHGLKAASPKPFSLLELFHPDGVAQRSVVIGGNCPEILRPLYCNEITEGADLAVLAPTPAECCASGWLEDAVHLVSRKLAADGVAYMVAPPLWRSRIRALLRDRDLSIDQTILHIPDEVSSRYLVPLSPIPARYAVSKLLSLTFHKRLLAAVGLCFVGSSRLLPWSLPTACLLVRRPGSRPTFDWLFRLISEENGSVLMTTSSRGKEGSVAVHCFPGHAKKPAVIAKITMKPAETVMGEVAAHRRLGPIARTAGAQVPQILSLTSLNGHSVLLQTALCGQSIGALLASRPNRLPEILERLVSWLESWNRSTRTSLPPDVDFLERGILAPARLVAAEIDQGDEYQQWLKTACGALTGTAIPLVTAHNDLTMWNLLLDVGDQLGVVDWDSVRENDLPFVDFFYAVVDAVMIASSFTERSKAVEACFVSGGAYERMVGQQLARLRRVVRAPDEMVELCFHACWLHHAANEFRAAKPSDPRPFREIAEWLALNRPRVGSWLRP